MTLYTFVAPACSGLPTLASAVAKSQFLSSISFNPATISNKNRGVYAPWNSTKMTATSSSSRATTTTKVPIDQATRDKILSSPFFLDDNLTLSDPSRTTSFSSSSSSTSYTSPQQPQSLSQEDLIMIAKRWLLSRNGFGGDPDLLHPDFQFEGPVVGPLSKSQFIGALSSIDLQTAFPDMTPQFYGFFVDPIDASDDAQQGVQRVWFMSRGRMTNTGPFPPFAKEPTGKRVIVPPQMNSVTIDVETGLIKRYTIGYVTDRSAGNTGGLGGLYGVLYAIGKPLPFREAQPWKRSLRYSLFMKLGSFMQRK